MEGVTLQELCTFFEQFDANGDGNVDLEDFKSMIRTSREATSLFTGSEELPRLSNAQMNALLLYDDWPQKHEGPGDLDEGEGLGGLFKHISKEHVRCEAAAKDEWETEEHAERRHALAPGGPRDEYPNLQRLDELAAELNRMEEAGGLWWYPEWKADKTEAELIFLETPDELPAWLDRMRVKKLSEHEKRIKVVELAEKLNKDAIIALAPQTWKIEFADAQDTSKEVNQEELLFFRLGFIFMAYRVDFWYWEAIEMTRKLILTSFLIFFGAGWVQLAFGSIVTFGFLLVNLAYRPYCPDGLNSLQALSLMAQFLTLFGGILIGYQRMDSANNESSDANQASNASGIGVLVVAINSTTLIWPLARKILISKHIEYYEKTVWILGLPYRFYMSFCGGEKRAAAARAKAKEERASRMRAHGIRRQQSMPDESWWQSSESARDLEIGSSTLVTALDEKMTVPAPGKDASFGYKQLQVHPITPERSGDGLITPVDAGAGSQELEACMSEVDLDNMVSRKCQFGEAVWTGNLEPKAGTMKQDELPSVSNLGAALAALDEKQVGEAAGEMSIPAPVTNASLGFSPYGLQFTPERSTGRLITPVGAGVGSQELEACMSEVDLDNMVSRKYQLGGALWAVNLEPTAGTMKQDELPSASNLPPQAPPRLARS